MNFGNLNLTQIFLFPFGVIMNGLDQFLKIGFLFLVTVECMTGAKIPLQTQYEYEHYLKMGIDVYMHNTKGAVIGAGGFMLLLGLPSPLLVSPHWQ